MVAAVIDIEPQLGDDLGSRYGPDGQDRSARRLLDAWSTRRSSLVTPDMDLTGREGHRRRVADASSTTARLTFGSRRVRAGAV